MINVMKHTVPLRFVDIIREHPGALGNNSMTFKGLLHPGALGQLTQNESILVLVSEQLTQNCSILVRVSEQLTQHG